MFLKKFRISPFLYDSFYEITEIDSGASCVKLGCFPLTYLCLIAIEYCDIMGIDSRVFIKCFCLLELNCLVKTSKWPDIIIFSSLSC